MTTMTIQDAEKLDVTAADLPAKLLAMVKRLLGEAPAELGSAVKVRASGRAGKLALIDHSEDPPYRVTFDDGQEPRAAWCQRGEVSQVGGWASVADEDVEVKQITGGITNMLYRLGPKGLDAYGGAPPFWPILARIFGEAGDAVCDRVAENKITAQIGDVGFGPKIHAVFGNGRLEEWLLGRRPLEPLEMIQVEPVDIVTLNAQKLAEFHERCNLSTGVEFWPQLREWIATGEKVAFPNNEAKAKKLAELRPYPRFAEEVAKLEDLFPSSKNGDGAALVEQAPAGSAERRAREILYEKRFTHMDLLAGNIMYSPSNGSVTFIDFEYAMNTCIGIDIANHFNAVPESCLIIENNFDVDKYYPKSDVQRRFLAAYMAARGIDVDEELLTALQKVILELSMVAELRWVIWSVVQAGLSPVDFDYLEYMRLRFEKGYLRYKELHESGQLL